MMVSNFHNANNQCSHFRWAGYPIHRSNFNLTGENNLKLLENSIIQFVDQRHLEQQVPSISGENIDSINVVISGVAILKFQQ
jgi:hypothetical protein